MNDALVVRVVERVEEIDRDVVRVGELELPLLLEHDAQRLPVQPLHHVVRQAKVVAGHAGGDDFDDVRVIEARERARLVLHAPREVFARAELRVQRLQDVALADRRILDVVDGAHPARADEADDLVHGARHCLIGLKVSSVHGSGGANVAPASTYTQTGHKRRRAR